MKEKLTLEEKLKTGFWVGIGLFVLTPAMTPSWTYEKYKPEIIKYVKPIVDGLYCAMS